MVLPSRVYTDMHTLLEADAAGVATLSGGQHLHQDLRDLCTLVQITGR